MGSADVVRRPGGNGEPQHEGWWTGPAVSSQTNSRHPSRPPDPKRRRGQNSNFVVSPHTPKTNISAFEKLVFGSDIFNGEIAEFDRELDLYKKLLKACDVPEASQQNVFNGTLHRILNKK